MSRDILDFPLQSNLLWSNEELLLGIGMIHTWHFDQRRVFLDIAHVFTKLQKIFQSLLI